MSNTNTYNLELLEEFMELNEFEQLAVKHNQSNNIEVWKEMGVTFDYTEQGVRELKTDLYFKPEEDITYYKHPRFVNISSHKHDFLELAYAFKGNFTQHINNTSVHAPEGSLILLDTNVVHSIEPVDKDTIVINILMRRNYFTDKLMKRFSKDNRIAAFIVSAIYKTRLNGSYLFFPLPYGTKVRSYIEDVLLELKHKDLGSQEYITSLMVILFTLLTRELNCQNKYLSDVHGSRDPLSSVLNILYYIYENYMDISLEDTAMYFHFHPNYLTRLLKKHTGKSFINIIIELKLEKAVSLLLNTTLSIQKISETSGFGNLNHFYTCFEKKYGCTPKEFRKADCK
ncbi:MAG: helix-turn-helix domain-containing protein [Clostridiales bacterium]|nr:helix-turn-helix domain-containing protein [Clostridiales bacterium]